MYVHTYVKCNYVCVFCVYWGREVWVLDSVGG